jgi:hypothetical protein
MIEMLMERDANGDGKIQREEISGRMERLFERLDANGDGVIDAHELAPGKDPGSGPGIEPEHEPVAEPEAGSPPAAPPTKPSPREEREEPKVAAADEPPVQEVEEPEVSEHQEAPEPAAAVADDPISGRWQAQVVGEEIPADEGEFSFTLHLAAEGKVAGSLQSRIGEGEIVDGRYDPETKKLVFAFVTEQMDMEFSAVLVGARLTGDIVMGGGAFSMPFEAKRTTEDVPEDERAAEQEEPKKPEHDWQTIDKLMPGPRWVSAIETSRFNQGRVYVTFDGHRSDDDEPYLFVSENHGETWRPIRGNLPTTAGSTRVIREDIANPDVLYLGTEFGAWVTIDRGRTWTSLNGNLPTVAVHELAQHPTSGEIVAATHGRSLWVMDVTPLRQMSEETIGEKVHLYQPGPAVVWRSLPSRGDTNRSFAGENPSSQAQIFYSIRGRVDRISLRITDQSGESIRELSADGAPGLHRVTWDLRRPAPEGRSSRYRRGPRVEPGTYLVELKADNLTLIEPLVIERDPAYD